MHVLRLTPHFYWPHLEEKGWPVKFDTIGGMQIQIFNQTTSLSAYGINQTVMSLRIPGVPQPWVVDKDTVVHGVRIPLFPVRSRLRGMADLNLSWLLGVLFGIRSMKVSPDIVHIHWSGVAIPPLLTVLLCKFMKSKIVVTVHCSSIATYHAMSTFDILQHRLAKFIERMAIMSADSVIALTPKSADSLIKAGAPEDRIAIISDSISVREFTRCATDQSVVEFKKRFSIPWDVPIVGYVGRVAREKGWRHLLDVIPRMKNDTAHLLVCGDGNERDVLESLVDENGLRNRLTVTGYLPHHEVATAIKACDLLLLTSEHEEFGSVLLEAMAIGTPTVAFGVGGIPYVLDEGAAGVLVEKGNAQKMADGADKLLSDDDFSESIALHAQERVLTCFDQDATLSELVTLYTRLLT